MSTNKNTPIDTTAMLDAIEQLCDNHQAQFTLTRASGTWIGFVRLADGRTIQHQSPLDQRQLIADTLDGLERMIGQSAGVAA